MNARKRYVRWCRYVDRYDWARMPPGFVRAGAAVRRHRPLPQWRKAVRRADRDRRLRLALSDPAGPAPRGFL